MLEELLMSVSGGGVLGGILGTVGSIFTKRQERKLLELQNAHEIKMTELSMQEHQLTVQGEIALSKQKHKITQTEAARDVEVAELSAFQESIKAASYMTGIKWVDAVRALMRPLLTTITMCAFLVTGFLTYKNATGIPVETLDELLKLIVNQVVFFAGTGFTWWFGSRPSATRKL